MFGKLTAHCLRQPSPRKQAHDAAIGVEARYNAAVLRLAAKRLTCQNVFFKQGERWRQNVAANLVILDGLQQPHPYPSDGNQQKTGEDDSCCMEQAAGSTAPVRGRGWHEKRPFYAGV